MIFSGIEHCELVDESLMDAVMAVRGSAQIVFETEKHQGELKDVVCSPKGISIEAMKALEERSLRSALIESMYVWRR